MTIHIPLVNGFVVAVSIVIGCVVFHRSRGTHDGRATKGDLAVAITVVGVSVLILGFLFGLGDGRAAPEDSHAPAPSSTAPSATLSPGGSASP